MKARFSLLLFFCSLLSMAQLKVLHYSETSGFDHQTRVNSLAMFQRFSNSANFTVVDDLNGSEFDTLTKLLQFDLIVFSNTSGDAILDSTQRSNFEQYIGNGGALLGIHAATDTYRHSTANGNRTGTWDFYAETIGGSVQENPNHVAGTPNYDISSIPNNSILNGIPNPWPKNEEYYYWESGYLNSNNQVLLEVEQTVGPNGQVNSYDSSRAVAWYKVTSNNARIFYTSLGHSNANYTSDTLFQKLVENATRWCLQLPTSLQEPTSSASFSLYPNPAKDFLYLEGTTSIPQIRIYGMNGKHIVTKSIQANGKTIVPLKNLSSGIYMISFETPQGVITKKFIVE